MNPNYAAHAALFLVALFYGGNYLIAKNVMTGNYIEPFGFVLLRVLTATSLFWLLTQFTRYEPLKKRDIPLLALCGLTGVVINQSLFFSGLEITTPVHASLIMTTTPMLVLALSHFVIHEKITLRKIFGIVCGCTGAIILISFGRDLMAGNSSVRGDIMVFVNATSYALYLVIVKKLTLRYSPLTLIKWVFTFGLAGMIPIGFSQLRAVDWTQFDLSVWLSVAYVLLCVTFLAYLLNLFALARVNPSTVSIYIYLQPLIASFLSVFFGMESITFVKVLSAVLIFTGVFLVSVAPRQRDTQEI